MSDEASVYRFYDANGGLLYIGMTGTWPTRAWQHSRYTPWFSEVATCSFEHFPSRDKAHQAERWAIYLERPKWNADSVKDRRPRDLVTPNP